VTGQHQLTLTATYDPSTYWLRPWFVRNITETGTLADYPSAVCAH
jgi:hypothetical protein